MTKALQTTPQHSIGLSKDLQTLEEISAFAEYIANNETFGKAFEKPLYENPDKPNEITRNVINKNDIVAAIVFGKELGISPMKSIMLGKSLNLTLASKIAKGLALGLSVEEARNVINIIPSKNGDIIHVGYQVIAKVLLDHNIKFHYTEDGKPILGWRELIIDTSKNKIVKGAVLFTEDTRSQLDDNAFFVYEKWHQLIDAVKAFKAGKRIVQEEVIDKRTTVVFNREGYEPLTISYTLQDATDAGLYNGYHSTDTKDGAPLWIDGKDNWNKHPLTMLRGRPLAIGGRIIGADFMHDTYSSEEAYEIVNKQPPDEEQEVEVVNNPE